MKMQILATDWSLALDEDERMVAASADAFLRDKANISTLRRIRDCRTVGGLDPAVWQDLGSIGHAGLLVPAAFGGSGLSLTIAGLVQQAAGKHLSRTPLLSTAILAASSLARRAGELQDSLLRKIATGLIVVAFVHEEGRRHSRSIATKAIPHGDKMVVTGVKTFAIDAPAADHFLVTVMTADGSPSMVMIDSGAAGVEFTAAGLVDGSEAGTIRLNEVEVPIDRLVAGADVVNDILDIGASMVASELVGLARELFTRTISYLKERKQFGVAIGSYQALQHRAAQLYCQLDLAHSAALSSTRALDTGHANASLLCSVAAAKAGQVAQAMADEAVQMHGGVGMTDAFDVGLFVKRAAVLETMFGDSYYHLDRVASLSGY